MLLRNCRHLARGYSRVSRPSPRLIVGNYSLPNGHYASVLMVRFASSNDRNKIDDTLRMLKEDLEAKQIEQKHKMQLAKKPPFSVRLTKYAKDPNELLKIVWKNVILHTWHGFRLFFLETRLSLKYIWKMRKQTLTRKERQQLIRTMADLFRLVPFSVFIIVPMMEIFLPLYIKIFPKMMPTTFQNLSKEEQQYLNQMKAKIETAKFLQDTLEEIAMTRKNKSDNSDDKSSKAYEFTQFLKKIREEEGGYLTNADLFKYIKLFEDEFTLDYLSMPMLRGLCRLLGIAKLGTPEILRFRLQMRLRELKADDKLILAEGGVDVLTVQELQEACRARGMRAIGLSEERLRNQLKQWLELSMNDKVPPSLLLLSRAMYFPEEQNFTERLKTIIAMLPKQIGEHTTLKLKELEGMTDPKARIELLKSIEQALREEAKEAKEREKAKEVDGSQKEKAKKMVEEVEDSAAAVQELYDVATDQTVALGIDEEKLMGKKAKELSEKQKTLAPELLESLEKLLHGSAEQEVKHDFAELKEKVIEHSEDLMEIGALAKDYEESKGAKKLRARVHKIISKVDLLAGSLENRKREIKETIADPTLPEAVEAKNERLVQIKDLIASLGKLQQLTSDRKQIEDTLRAMDIDVDGKVEADLILEVLEMLQKHKDIDISVKEIAKLVELLRKEELVEELEDRREANGHSSSEEHPKIAEEEMPKLTANDEFPIRSMAPESVKAEAAEHSKKPPPTEFEPKPPMEKSQSQGQQPPS